MTEPCCVLPKKFATRNFFDEKQILFCTLSLSLKSSSDFQDGKDVFSAKKNFQWQRPMSTMLISTSNTVVSGSRPGPDPIMNFYVPKSYPKGFYWGQKCPWPPWARIEFFVKYGPIPASFSFIFVLSTSQINYKLKKHRWSACDLNQVLAPCNN